MIKVSVIIPNYNHERFLEKRIRSVLDQTFRDFEVILLDDASSDNSRDVFAMFADDPRVRSILNDTNSGSVFRQWNKGFREARGEYVWVAESDDYADKRFLEVLVEQLDNHPSAGVAYCQSWVVDENDKELYIIEHNRKHIEDGRWTTDFVNNGKQECSDYFVMGCMINNVSSALLRKSVVEQIGYADEDWRIAGDWMFWTKMLLASDIAFVAQPLNFWRQHSGTVRNSTARDGIMVTESYKVANYIAGSVTVRKDVMERARALRFKSWVCRNEIKFFGFAQNKAIYDQARKFDPSINARLARYLPLAPLRTVARRLLRRYAAT